MWHNGTLTEAIHKTKCTEHFVYHALTTLILLSNMVQHRLYFIVVLKRFVKIRKFEFFTLLKRGFIFKALYETQMCYHLCCLLSISVLILLVLSNFVEDSVL